MKRSIEVARVIPASSAAVWSELSEIENHVKWMADAESLHFHSDQRRGTGVSFDCITKVGPFRLRDTMTVTQWREGQAIGVTHTGLVTGSGIFALTAHSNDHTTVTWNETLNFPVWMFGFVGAYVAGFVLKAIWKQNLARLEALILC
jgi:uncharacterized protein YndB with AHSA1/START domain